MKMIKDILSAVKGTYKEIAAGNTKKNIKSLLSKKKKKKSKKKRVDIYSRGQERKRALENIFSKLKK